MSPEHTVAANNHTPSPRPHERIVFLGDSITQGGAGPDGYVTLTAKMIAEAYPAGDIQIINAGISGNKVPDCQERLQRDVLDQQPTLVLIYIGINDVWHWKRQEGTPKPQFVSGLRDIVTRIQAAGARIILCTPTVIGEKNDGTNEYDPMLDDYADAGRQIADAYGIQLLDLRKAFLAYLKKHNPQNNEQGILTQDTVHLSATGNRVLADLVTPALKTAIDTRSA